MHGEPFNITDVEVGPDGLMYFTTGGRSTTGGLWRLRYNAQRGAAPAAPDMTGILAVVRQPQPLSSWGWAAIEKVKAGDGRRLRRRAREARAQRVGGASGIGRAPCYEMQRHGAAPNAALLTALAADKSPEVRAAAIYVAGVQGQAAEGRGGRRL